MNILVTGGAGFIGSHFVLNHRQTKPADTIVVLDLLTYAGSKNLLESVIKDITFIQGDIADKDLVAHIVDQHRIDTIVNFAAETHVDRSIEDAHPFLHSNILGLQTLIDVCKAHPTVLLHHVSTDEVYGDLADDDSPNTVEDPLKPSSPYAASKAAADLLLLASVRTYGIRARISRCTNNYGPHQANEKFMPTVIRSALAAQPIPIYAEGKNKRDWLYVTDHCTAIEVIIDKGTDGKIYNVSAGEEKENIQVAKTILTLTQKPETLLSFVKDRPGHDWRYAVDSTAVRAMGWQPQVHFEEGLAKTIEWYKNN